MDDSCLVRSPGAATSNSTASFAPVKRIEARSHQIVPGERKEKARAAASFFSGPHGSAVRSSCSPSSFRSSSSFQKPNYSRKPCQAADGDSYSSSSSSASSSRRPFSSVPQSQTATSPGKGQPSPNKAVILYTTSLRGIRKTYDDCRSIRAILRALRVSVDERDVSMDAAFKTELRARLPPGAPLSLPQAFVGCRWIGGAEELRRMHEDGELRKVLRLEGVAEGKVDPAYGGDGCNACGGVRFVPCGECSGSRKLFDEDAGRTKRCGSCNENGLVRCADCSVCFP